MITFRKALPKDSERLTELALTSKQYWGYTDDFMHACGEELSQPPEKIKKPDYFFEVAIQQDLIVGFYCLERLSDLEAEIEALFISPDIIGRGLGRLCWDSLVSSAKKAGFKKLKIASDPNALPFYLKMGAVEAGRIPSESVSGRYLPLLEFNLS